MDASHGSGRDVTRLLHEWRAGKADAREELMPFRLRRAPHDRRPAYGPRMARQRISDDGARERGLLEAGLAAGRRLAEPRALLRDCRTGDASHSRGQRAA